MNKIHRVLWSRCRHQFVVVAENARSDGGGSQSVCAGAGLGASIDLFLLKPLWGLLAGVGWCVCVATAPALLPLATLAQVPPPKTQLPTGGQVTAGQARVSQSGATMTITQSSARVRTVIASVNGAKIHSDMLEQMVSEGVANGAKDSPEFRAALKNELIARTVLAQEASKQGVEQIPATQNQLLMARTSILANQVMSRYVEKNPVTDEQLRNEYKRQLAGLGDAEQFLVRHIVLETETQAMDALKSLRSGADFANLAKDKSLDNSKQNGGSLGWLLPNQLIPPLANVVVNLNQGAVSAAPIATSVGWQLIKLEDKRKFQPPTFEESKPLLLRSLQANQQSEYVQKLVKAAKVEDK